MIMLICHRLLTHRKLVLLPMLVVTMAAPSRAAMDIGAAYAANSSVVSAESALQRGDCGAASTLYAQATKKLAQSELAARATSVALACGQYSTARATAERWVQLVPGDPTALLALTEAQLRGDQTDAARKSFQRWLAGSGGNADAKGTEPKATLKVPEVIAALAQTVGAESTLAMLRDIKDPRLRGAPVQLALSALALDSWDAAEARRYAHSAQVAGAKPSRVAVIESRAMAILGDSKGALAAARSAASDKSGRLSLAETQLLLGLEPEAQAELLRLRSDPEVGSAAARLLAQTALETADYAIAEQRCKALLQDPSSAALGVYYLGVIAERRGDDASAERNYALLAGTPFESQGRQRAAMILYKQGERDAAVRVLSGERDAQPEERIRGEIAAAQLLADAGAHDESVSRIEGALRRAPGHPELAYQRAVLLDRGGRIDAAIATLEGLHRERPHDAGITNALGFTLADHKRDLPRAEQLIRAALATQPDNPALLDSLGWVLYRRGQNAAALPALARAFRLLHDGDVGAHWGEVLWVTGQKSAAQAAWKRALAADPENKLLAATVHRYTPTLSAPKPPPALEPAPRTSI